jgi:PTS system mannitol-specific IIA component
MGNAAAFPVVDVIVSVIRRPFTGNASRQRSPRSMSDILALAQIKTPGTATTKDDAIREAGQILVDAGAVSPAYVDAMFEREKSVSTYMGNYLAIPHGTNEAKDTIAKSGLSVVRYEQPIDWDGNEVRFAVGIAGVNNGHLEILGKIAVIFSDMDEVDKMIAAGSAEEVYELLHAVNDE